LYRRGPRRTELTAFFELCDRDPQASNLTFMEVCKYYTFAKREKEWIPRQRAPKGGHVIACLLAVNPTDLEKFAIRCLVQVKEGPVSFKDLRTVDGKEYSTFVKAAIACGLMEDESMWIEALKEAAGEHYGVRQFIGYFARLIGTGRPKNVNRLVRECLDDLVPPREDVTDEMRLQRALHLLEYYFTHYLNLTLGEVGIQEPDYDNTSGESMTIYSRYLKIAPRNLNTSNDPLLDTHETAKSSSQASKRTMPRVWTDCSP
jgi:hypothetical protein